MDHSEQADLVLKTQRGEPQAFGRLYDHFIQPIYRFVYYKTHHTETAEDITSLVFTQALTKIQSFNPNRGVFSGWLYQIARNCIIDHYRGQKTAIPIDDAFDMSDGVDIAHETHVKIELGKVEQYLKKLTSEQRDIIIMRVWQNMSYSEIAEALGKSEASCKMMFGRVIKKLQEEMPLAITVLLLMHL